MKRLVLNFILMASLLAALTACSKGTGHTPAPGDQDTPAGMQEPEIPYGSENNNYYDKDTRAYKEQYGPASERPAIKKNLEGKTVVPFITSGSTGIDAAASELESAYPDIKWKSGGRLNGKSAEELKAWLEKL
jgi:hypothetical protein